MAHLQELFCLGSRTNIGFPGISNSTRVELTRSYA
ncbi:hypothetical protein EDF70_11066 [Neorhizobium sp. JUb45]|nr:hypothetical protein EDF70_11066 [Neorhizobium sp. JUb45]